MGDINLGRYITATARSRNDYNWSFSEVSDWLKQNDINLANLEGPIVTNCPTSVSNTMIFCGDPKFLPALKENKFAFNLANNHILNYGQNGLSQTKDYLDNYSINYVYSHHSETEFKKISINNISLGLMGFDLTGGHRINKDNIISLVKKYNSEVDWLIISLHWGDEYKSNPSTTNVDFAHQLIDNGVDIIAGHHPHVYQAVEIYKDKPIYYSLGNFIFDQNWSKATSESKIIKIKLTKNQILETKETRIMIKSNSQPNLVE